MIELDSIRKGYYEIWVDGVKISQHTDLVKANSRGLEEKHNNMNSEVVLKQPYYNFEVKIDTTEIDRLTQENEDMLQQIIALQSAASNGGGAVVVDPPVIQTLKAFPDAYGGGADATGGRGGNVYHVTNLSDPFINIDGTNYPDTDSVDYPGSFRWALNQARPATIVFDVSGILVIQSWLDWSGTDLTIAGQSAPVGGITVSSVAGNRFRIRSNGTTDNLIMRYIRIRPVSESGDDAFEPFEDNTITNVIFDHLSVSYGGDEGFSMRVNPGGTINNITFQRSILAENKTGSLYGTSWDNTVAGQATITSSNMSWNNNLSFNNSHRSPNVTSNGRFDYINNIVHNWEDSVGAMYGNIQANIMNNYFSLGERATFNGAAISSYSQHNGWSLDDEQDNLGGFFTPSLYINGNVADKLIPTDDDYVVNDDNWNMVWQWKNASGPNDYRVEQSNIAFRNLTPPTQIGQAMTVQSAVDAYNDVRTDSGTNASLNADGTVTYHTDIPDTEYLATIATEGDFIHYNQYDQFKPYDYNPTFPTYKASVVAVDGISSPINTRPEGFYVSNAHIPEAYLIAKGLPQNATVHNDLNPTGYTYLEQYLNEVDN